MSNELRAMSEEPHYPWMNGFESMFDTVYFDALGEGVKKQITLSKLGVLSRIPTFADQLPPTAGIPIDSLKTIKANEGYSGLTDAVKFALGARAAFKSMELSYV